MPDGEQQINLESWLKQHPKISEEDYRFWIRYGLSQLRIPLTGIKGYLSLIVSGEIPKPDKKLLTGLLTETERVMYQVGVLTDFSKKYEDQKKGDEGRRQNKSIKIVMFEDDKFLSDMYRIYLEKAGFQVVCFEHPQKNLVEVIIREKPDLISMGVIMPQMDGFKAAEILKDNDQTKSIPLVFLTNMGAPEDIEKGLSLGAKDYIVRANVQPEEVVNKFKKILGK